MRYEAPDTLERAVALLSAETGLSRVLAGGTDVLVQLRSGVVEPDLIVDIKRAGGVNEIKAEDGGWRIGAAVPGAVLAEHEGVCRDWPGVVEALELVGSTQVQSRATLAGNRTILGNWHRQEEEVPKPSELPNRSVSLRPLGTKGNNPCSRLSTVPAPG